MTLAFPALRDAQLMDFHQLQQQLRERWQTDAALERDDCDILVLPSFSLDQQTGQKVAGFLHYEERLLFSLIRLRSPNTRLIYVTRQPPVPHDFGFRNLLTDSPGKARQEIG